MFQNIKIKTASQEVIVKAHELLTLEEILRVNRIPTNLFQGYILETKEGAKPIPLNIRLVDLPDDAEITL
jgi:hypothetical protein